MGARDATSRSRLVRVFSPRRRRAGVQAIDQIEAATSDGLGLRADGRGNGPCTRHPRQGDCRRQDACPDDGQEALLGHARLDTSAVPWIGTTS
jgi:hypothetical protein